MCWKSWNSCAGCRSNGRTKLRVSPKGQKAIGVIAQEAEAVFPELVSSSGKEGYKAVAYGNLTGVLIEAVKELRAEKDAQIAALESRLAKLEASVRDHSLPVQQSSVLSTHWLIFGGLLLAGFVLGQYTRQNKSELNL
jgi:hypothetical protein